MKNSTKFTITTFSIFLLFGCGPSPEEIAEQERLARELEIFEQKKDEVKVLYETLLSMPEEQPCNNMEEFKNLSELEKNYGTKLFNEITKDRISFYTNECEKYKLQRKKEEVLALHDEIILNMQDQKPCINLNEFENLKELDELNQTYLFEELTQEKIDFYSDECEKYTELNSLGNWIIVNYRDDFGELTGEKGLNLRAKGSFSNSATSNSSLSVNFVWNQNDLWLPVFYLFEYDMYRVRGTYRDRLDNTMECRFRDSKGDTRRMDLYQRQGSDQLYARDNEINARDYINENTKIFKNLVREGDKVMFVCERDFSNVYKFTLDFKYAKNAKRKLNE